MPNFEIPKGGFTIVGITLYKYDLDINGQLVPDLTSPIATQLGAPTALVVEPVNPGASNREFYVSVKSTETVNKTGQNLNLTASIPADGLGAGAPAFGVLQQFTFDTLVPVDHRGSAKTGPSTVQPLPHP